MVGIYFRSEVWDKCSGELIFTGLNGNASRVRSAGLNETGPERP